MNHHLAKRFSLLSGIGMLVVGAVVSCKVGPNYERPAMDVPTTYKSAASQAVATTASSQAAASQAAQIRHLATDWWMLFNDADLTTLEQAAIAHNFDLQAAMARVAEARASSRSVASAFYPQIAANPSAIRSRTSGTEGGPSRTASRISIPFDLSYEVDIWGRVSRSYEASKAQVQASVDDYAVILQTLEADVAQDYFNLRSLEVQDEILNRSVALYVQQIDLTQRKQQVGLSGAIDVVQIQALLEAARSQLIDSDRQRGDLEHALAILVGRPPADFSMTTRPRALDPLPPSIPAGLPADLLGHRPDVAEAEQNLVAANAQVGVATANFYPVVTLTGAAGFESIDVQHIVDWESRIWSLGPSVSIPIFEGGKLTADLQQAKARYNELVATYRSSVLGAFRDVEVSLTDVHGYSDGLEAENRAMDAARDYLRLTQAQIGPGLVSTLQVIDADRTLLTNELAQNQILTQRMISTVLLIKALGGGWDLGVPAAVPATKEAVRE